MRMRRGPSRKPSRISSAAAAASEARANAAKNASPCVSTSTPECRRSAPRTVAGRLIAMLLMLIGIGFIAVLTASIASIFIKSERQDETEAISQALRQIQADLAELKARLSP